MRFFGGCTLSAAVFVMACGVPEPSLRAHGVDVPRGPCGRGLVVARSDYLSTSISLVDFEGGVLSPVLISSGTGTVGLSAPLSGDVVLPNHTPSGAEVVVLDRYPASVLSWVNVQTADVSRQLSVATGFAANARDYLELSPDKAYVTRFERNLAAGREPFDSGGDVLIVDPAGARILDSIDLSSAGFGAAAFLPRPGPMVQAGGDVFVLLSPYDASFTAASDSRIVRLDTSDNTVSEVFLLSGLSGCSGMALSPSGGELAVTCSGMFDSKTVDTPASSGVAVVRIGDVLSEVTRVSATALGRGPLSFSVGYADADTLLVSAFGNLSLDGSAARNDVLARVDVRLGDVTALTEVQSEPFDLGQIRCAPACGLCFVADAASSGVWRLAFEPGKAASLETGALLPLRFEDGLPPRYIGLF